MSLYENVPTSPWGRFSFPEYTRSLMGSDSVSLAITYGGKDLTG